MRRSMNIILTVLITCSLILGTQYSILAQKKQAAKNKKAQGSGMEMYKSITQNNLFKPLGSGGKVKRTEYILAGILGSSAFIKMEGSNKSFYVTEGQEFGNGAKLIRIGKSSVTIMHEGSEKELELASGAVAGRGGGARGGKARQRQNNSGKSGSKMKAANNKNNKNWDKGETPSGGKGQWARKMSVDELHNVRGEIANYIEGMEKKGIRDPEAYKGVMEKMEIVEQAISDKR